MTDQTPPVTGNSNEVIVESTVVPNVAPETTSTPVSSNSETPAATVEITDWRATLTDDIKAEPSLVNIKTVNDLAKGYLSAQRMVGGRIPIPTKEASKEVQDEFYNKLTSIPNVVRLPDDKDPNAETVINQVYEKLGRPKTPEQYKLNLPEGMPVDESFVKEIKEIAHKHGLNDKQLNALAEVEMKKTNEMLEVLNVRKENTVNYLKKEWGTEFSGRTELADSVMRKYSERMPNEVKELMTGHSATNPVLIMMAAELGRMYQESGIIKGGSASTGMTPEQARQELADIQGNKQHAYYNHRDPGHEVAVERVRRLYNHINPPKSA